MAPCCLYQSSQNYSSAADWLQSQELQNLQQSFLTQDHLPAGCHKCQRHEAQGLPSLRSKYNATGQHLATTEITELEFFSGNACNLNCVFCAPWASTGVGQEYKKLGWIDHVPIIDQTQSVLQTLKRMPQLSLVGITGGEFFVTKNNLEILDAIIDRQLQLKIVTNATCLTPQHLDKLAKIRNLNIAVSIDGIGQVYEFLRYPAQWSNVQANITYLKRSLPSAKIHIMTVLHPLIIQHLVELFDWANRQLLPINVINIENRDWLSWAILNQNECLQLSQQLIHTASLTKLTAQQKNIVTNTASMLQSTVHNSDFRRQFVSKISQIIAARKTDTYVINTLFGTLTDLRDQIWHHLSDSNARPPAS